MKNLIRLFLAVGILFASSIGANLSITKNFDVYASSISPIVQENVTATIPTSYDLRDDIYIQVENQNPYGLCWSFASLTSVETYLAKQYQEYYDFSELHLAISRLMQEGSQPSINDTIGGGNFHDFFTYIQKDKALVLEDEYSLSDYNQAQYLGNDSTITDKFKTINNNFYPLVEVNKTIEFPNFSGSNKSSQTGLTEFRNSVKQHIINYGSLYTAIYYDDSYLGHYYDNSNNAYSYYYKVTNASINTNHAISIIGWDDNYNAGGAWTNKGAYLCLNSWGESWGDNGTFYVSYDDVLIEAYLSGVTNATLATQSSQINTFKQYPQYTRPTIGWYYQNGYTGTITIANIIDTSKYLNSYITSIDHFILGSSTEFKIKFFSSKDVAKNTIKSFNANNQPTTDWQSFTLTPNEESIYDTYNLSSKIKVTDNFMVLISRTYESARWSSFNGYSSTYPLDDTYLFYSSSLFIFEKTVNEWLSGDELYQMIPVIIHTDTEYAQVNNFSSSIDSYIDGTEYIQNNAIFKNKKISFNITNCTVTNCTK